MGEIRRLVTGTTLLWVWLAMIGCPRIHADDMADYRRQIQECRPFLMTAAQAERMATGSGWPWALEAVRRLGPAGKIQIDGRQHVNAQRAMRETLRTLYGEYIRYAPDGLDAAVNSLDTRMALLLPSIAPPPMVMARAEEALSQELKSAAYQVRYFASLRQSIDEFIQQLMQNLIPGDFSGDGVTFVLLMLLLGVVGTALGLLLIRLARLRRRRGQAPAEEVPAWEEIQADSESCMRFAEQAAAEGRYEDALRWLFRAALQSLQDDGRVEDRPGCTNWELVRILERGYPQTAGPFRQMVMLFDAHIYGGRVVTEERYRHGRDLLQAVRAGEPT